MKKHIINLENCYGIKKLVIKDVVLYADSKITTTKKVVSNKYDI